MLRIVLEFYDVAGAVIAAHQVRLRAAAHATDVLYCQRHGSACYAAFRNGSSELLRGGGELFQIGAREQDAPVRPIPSMKRHTTALFRFGLFETTSFHAVRIS